MPTLEPERYHPIRGNVKASLTINQLLADIFNTPQRTEVYRNGEKFVTVLNPCSDRKYLENNGTHIHKEILKEIADTVVTRENTPQLYKGYDSVEEVERIELEVTHIICEQYRQRLRNLQNQTVRDLNRILMLTKGE